MKRFTIGLVIALCLFVPTFARAQSYVGSADLGNNGGTTSSLTASYTVGSGANRLLVVLFNGDLTNGGVDDCSGVTFNGSSMTLARKSTQNSNGRIKYFYYLASPASGSHNVVITCSSNHYILALAADYQGFAGTLDNTVINTTPNTTSLTTTLTVAANTWAILLEDNYGAATPAAGSGATFRIVGAAFKQPAIFDSNGTLSAGSYSMTTTASDGGTDGIDHIMASFPVTPGAPNTAASIKKKKQEAFGLR